jgi:hypothetical protein
MRRSAAFGLATYSSFLSHSLRLAHSSHFLCSSWHASRLAAISTSCKHNTTSTSARVGPSQPPVPGPSQPPVPGPSQPPGAARGSGPPAAGCGAVGVGRWVWVGEVRGGAPSSCPARAAKRAPREGGGGRPVCCGCTLGGGCSLASRGRRCLCGSCLAMLPRGAPWRRALGAGSLLGRAPGDRHLPNVGSPPRS